MAKAGIELGTKAFIKEVLFLLDEQPIIILTNGLDRLSVASVAEYLQVDPAKLVFPDRRTANNVMGLRAFNFFDKETWPKGARVILNEQFSVEDTVVMSMGLELKFLLTVDPAGPTCTVPCTDSPVLNLESRCWLQWTRQRSEVSL